MRVKRIVTNIAADPERIAEAKRFYGAIFGLDLLMDMGWIATYGSNAKMTVQLSIMTEGFSTFNVPVEGSILSEVQRHHRVRFESQ
jgi:hypothetical protein